MIVINFAQFKREMEVKNERDYTIADIEKGAGVSRDTISRLMKNKVTRIDVETVSKLCSFFNVKDGPVPFIVFEEKP